MEITRSRKAEMRSCENGLSFHALAVSRFMQAKASPFWRWRYEIRSVLRVPEHGSVEPYDVFDDRPIQALVARLGKEGNARCAQGPFWTEVLKVERDLSLSGR